MEENNYNETSFEEEQRVAEVAAEQGYEEEHSSDERVEEAVSEPTSEPAQEQAPQQTKKQKSPLGYIVVGILTGFLLSLAVLMLCRGYYTIQIPGIGVLSVKLPTFGIFHNANTSVDMAEFERKTEEIEYYLQTYLYGTDTAEATDGAVRGFYEQLTGEDDYAEYYTKEEYEQMMTTTSGSFVGIGVSVVKDDVTGAVKVMQTLKGGSAEEAGLKAGDLIIEAEGLDLTEMELDEAVSHIKGDEGTTVDIVVIRGEERLTYTLERRQVDNQTVYYSELEQEGEKVGYIYVSQFYGTTLSAFREAVDALTDSGVRGFVIDLREDTGGDMNVCLNMLDYMLKDNDTTYLSNLELSERNGETLLLSLEGTTAETSMVYFADDGHSVDLPVVMLVDDYSASASEIFTGVMKAYGAKVVGVNTFGKGIVQNLYMLYDGSGIKYTIAEYVLPDGVHLHKTGIKPDVEVEPSEELLKTGADVEAPDPGIDNQLNEALKVLGEMMQ